jgi:putative flippase GtrA
VRPGFLGFALSALGGPSKDNSLKAQAFRLVLAGGAATLVDLSVFKLCVVMGLHPMLAAVVSFCLAFLTNYFLTRHFVFGEVAKQRKKTSAQVFIYFLTCLVSLGIAQAFILLFHFRLGFDPFWAKVLSVPVVFVWSVISGRFIVFDKAP